MPVELKNYIDLGYTDGGAAHAYLSTARNNLYYAGDRIAVQDWAGAKEKLYASADAFGLFSKNLLQDDVFYKGLRRDWRDALYWINDNWPTGAEVTMDAILNAMLTTSFDNLRMFIGIEDAYRVALWNAPFNVDFYAALARGFTVWL